MQKLFSVVHSLVAIAVIGMAQDSKTPTPIAITPAEVNWGEPPPSLSRGAVCRCFPADDPGKANAAQ